MKIPILLGVSLAVLGAVMTGFAAENTRAQLVKEIGAETLVQAAWQTHARWVKAGGGEKASAIPEAHWADAIRKLKPVRLHVHRVNVVAVLKAGEDAEEGLYLCIPISSYAPQDGDDGFRFKPVARDILEYQRKLRAAPTAK